MVGMWHENLWSIFFKEKNVQALDNDVACNEITIAAAAAAAKKELNN